MCLRRGLGRHAAALAATLAVVLALVGWLSPRCHADDLNSEVARTARCPQCGREIVGGQQGSLCRRCEQKKATLEPSAPDQDDDEEYEGPGILPFVVVGVFVAGAVVVTIVAIGAARAGRRQPVRQPGKKVEVCQEIQSDNAQRQEVAHWHDELKRQPAARTPG